MPYPVRQISSTSRRMPTLMLLAAIATPGCGHPSAASPPTTSQRPTSAENTASNDEGSSARPAPTPTSASDVGPQDSARQLPNASSASQPVAPPSKRPPADRGPQKPGDPEKITFEDLNLGLQADVVFRPYMINDDHRAKALDGKRVSLAGYMHGAVASKSGIKEFVLLRNLECKFGPGGQADHLAQVILRGGTTTNFSPSPIKVEGTLRVEPFQGPDGNTWAIYRLEEAGVH